MYEKEKCTRAGTWLVMMSLHLRASILIRPKLMDPSGVYAGLPSLIKVKSLKKRAAEHKQLHSYDVQHLQDGYWRWLLTKIWQSGALLCGHLCFVVLVVVKWAHQLIQGSELGHIFFRHVLEFEFKKKRHHDYVGQHCYPCEPDKTEREKRRQSLLTSHISLTLCTVKLFSPDRISIKPLKFPNLSSFWSEKNTSV